MTRIAISYRRDDSAGITGRIFDRLVAHYGGDSVFRDIDNIPVGVDFREHINSILAQTDITLVVVGKRWSGPLPRRRRRIDDPADPVRVEVETALRNGLPVVPVLVEGGAMPNVEQLPDSLREFVYRNGLEVDSGRDFDQHIERLIRSMEPILARRSKDLEEATPRVEEERQRAKVPRQAGAENQQAEEERQRAKTARQAEGENQQAHALRQAEDRQIDRPPRLHGSWLAIAVGIFFVMTVAGGGYWLYTEVQQRAAAVQKAAEEKQGADAARRAAEEKQRADTARRAAEEKQRADAAQRAVEEKQRADAAQKAVEEKQRADAAQRAVEEKQRTDAAQKAVEEKQRADAAQKAMVVPPTPENSAVSTGVAAYDRKDYSTALRTLQPAAQAGDRLAQYYLGVMYLNGYGVPKKPDLALDWLSKAASAGVRDAQSYMGAFNRRGDLVPRNYEEAMRWYLLAAKQDYENSQYNIALMYYRGEGVKQDLLKAYMWAVISSMGGEPEPNRLRMKLEQSLSASEITEGQREAALWRAENITPK